MITIRYKASSSGAIRLCNTYYGISYLHLVQLTLRDNYYYFIMCLENNSWVTRTKHLRQRIPTGELNLDS